MGRKPIGKEIRKRYQVMLEPNTREYFRRKGDGNVSMGIHLVALEAMTRDLVRSVRKLPKQKPDNQS